MTSQDPPKRHSVMVRLTTPGYTWVSRLSQPGLDRGKVIREALKMAQENETEFLKRLDRQRRTF